MNLSEVNTYESAVSYCLAVPRFTKKNNPESTKEFFEFLGRPAEDRKIIHIAGTNGKGSVSAFLQSICIEAGKKVGMFTSPHLCDIRERIRINGEMVTQEAFLEAFIQVRNGLVRYWDAFPDKREYHPTYFELLFFIGMVCFAKENTEFLLLETGLGGRLDATNIIENPALCVITKVGYDHMEYLGDTLEKIAAEKAGIIKPGTPVVYWKEKEGVDRVIEEKAKSLSCPCISVSKELVDLHFFGDKRIDFSYNTRYYGYVRFSVSTKAVYQTENAALAIAAAEQVLGKDMLQPIQKGIAAMHWAGRMEEVLPNVFFDGAHNEDGIDAFLASVKCDACKGKRSLLFSVVQDKQYEKMAGMILDSNLFDRIYTAPIQSDRSITREELEALFAGGTEVSLFATPEDALREMLDDRGVDDYLYVAGSLYLIGQLKEWLKELSND